MAVRIRLKRIGRRKRPFYRVIAIDSRRRRDGAEIERLGWYDPLNTTGEKFRLNDERIFYWLKVGAQPSTTVKNLMSKSGIALRWHLMRQGQSPEEVEAAFEEWHEQQLEHERRREALVAQKKRKKKTVPKAPAGEVEVKAEAAEEEEAAAPDEAVAATEATTAEAAEEPVVEATAEEEPAAGEEAPAEATGEAEKADTAEEPAAAEAKAEAEKPAAPDEDGDESGEGEKEAEK